MEIRKIIAATAAILLCGTSFSQVLAGTYRFATKDGQDLLLDEYKAAPGSRTTVDGRAKPAIIWVFGGGFVNGERSEKNYLPWFKMLNDEGYTVLTIDYRLGMKGVRTKGGFSSVKQFYNAIQIAAEDLFSATKFIIENAGELDVDPNNLVVSGSSAGAITALQAEWMLCNGKATEDLPEDFNYAGLMSFSGSILSRKGMPEFAKSPAPTAFFHGTSDRIVNYGKIHFLNWAFAGTDKLVKIYRKNGYIYNAFRYNGHSHEIASSMQETFPEQIRFLETNVVKGVARVVDTTIDDPELPEPFRVTDRKGLYSGN